MRYLIYILLIMITYGCKINGYYFENRRFYHFETSYNRKDSLYIADYIFYGLDGETKLDGQFDVNGWMLLNPVKLNEDSLYNKFQASFEILAIPSYIDSVYSNKINEDFFSIRHLKYKNINKKQLIDIAQNKERIVLMPIIYFYFGKSTHVNSAGADPYPHYVCRLTLAIFIVKNEKIIYYKQMSYVEVVDGEFHPYKYEDFHIPIPQEHWDGLVREVMKEYIERLR